MSNPDDSSVKPGPVTESSSVTVIESESESNLEAASPSPAKSLFGGGGSNSFASFATDHSGSSSFLNKSENNAGTFDVDPKKFHMLTGAKIAIKSSKMDDEEAAGDNVSSEEFVPNDALFKRPDIALSDLVEVKTGEENEKVLFSARCRLYRFMPGNDVKEHGTGDIKILKNRADGKLRCVMRREQVLKVCANFAIPPGFTVSNTKRGDNVLTWSCKDFSESAEGEVMTLVCRFKDVDTAKKFTEVARSA